MSQVCSLCGRGNLLNIWRFRKGDIKLCGKCWPSLPPVVDWFEKRYNALQKNITNISNSNHNLFKPMGVSQSHVKVEDGEWLVDRVVEHLSLNKGEIIFEFKNLETKVAGTIQNTGTGYLVQMSEDLRDNPRALSAILIHEMMHIFLSNHNLSYTSTCELEELTDLCCVLMGLGIPLINAKQAWHVEKKVLGYKGLVGEQKYYEIGYLTQQQIGYAFAYYMTHNFLKIGDIKDSIDPQCWHIISSAYPIPVKVFERVMTRRKTAKWLREKSDIDSNKNIYQFSCPVCAQKMGVSKNTVERIGILKAICPKCATEIYFDGKKIVNFIEPRSNM